jgi:LacI family transcriptional regulator
MTTIYQVADLAGVSLATVSRVINNTSPVSDKTRQKVLAAMAQLRYRPNAIAQALASQRSNCIGVLVSELHGAFFGAMLSAVEGTLKEAGKFVIVAAGHNSAAQEQEALEFLASRSCDALIVHVEALPDKALVEYNTALIPLVVMNRKVRGLPDRCVSLNNRRGGSLATQLLLEMGHRRIAYVSGPLGFHDARERLAGHKHALAKFTVELDERLVHEGDYHEAGGARALERLLETRIPFSAIVCANDEMAAGAMAAARERGIGIPEDLSIVGFDNAPISRYMYPPLATVDYPIGDMGRMAARWVLRNIYENTDLEIELSFEPVVLPRKSVARVAT